MIHNTHYNIIDTIAFAFGEEKWKNICNTLFPLITADMIKNVEISSNDSTTVIDKFIKDSRISKIQGMTNAMAYTLVECLFWSYQNNSYGIPT